MLSENIEILRGALAKFSDEGVMASPEAIVRICVLLDAMKRDAQTMEQALHAPMVSVSDLVTGKVVPFKKGQLMVLLGDAP